MTLRSRLLISLIFALIVGGLTLLSTWRSLANGPWPVDAPRIMTRSQMHWVGKLVDDFRQRHHRLPKSLDEVARDQPDQSRVNAQDFDDGWQRPLIYVVDGGRYELISYGQDGRPGGDALDGDIYSDRPMPPIHMSFADFLKLPTFANILMLVLLTAGICFAAAWEGLRKSGRLTFASVAGMIVIALVTAVMGGVITILHVYPDH